MSHTHHYPSPVGSWELTLEHDRITQVSPPQGPSSLPIVPFDVRKRLDGILAGSAYDGPLGQGTRFQEQVWAAINAIPFGETRSYGDIARAIGKPGASRAVGSACAANPLPLLVPCHRVVKSDGSPGGYMGQPATRFKEDLLALEAKAKHAQVARNAAATLPS